MDNTLIYPILNVALLLCHVVCTYHGLTPPTSSPPPQDQERFTAPDFMTKTTYIQLKAVSFIKLVFCSVGIAEALILTVQLTSTPSKSLPSFPIVAHNVTTIGSIFGILGGLIRVWCHHTLGHLFTWQMSIRDDHQLITTGPYAFVRHPSYTGWTLNAIGNLLILFHCSSSTDSCASSFALSGRMAVILLGAASYHMFVTYSVWTRMKKEDAVMRQHFEKQWDVWAQSTPYSLIPFVY